MTDTQSSAPQQPSAEQPVYASVPAQPYAQPPAPAPQKPQRNILGIIALALAAVGFVFACIPGALIVGWILLPVAFVLGIVAVCLKGRAKWQGLTAIIVSVVGTIVGFIVFFSLVATAVGDAVDESFGGTDVTIGETTEGSDTAAAAEDAPAEVGTRANPVPLGTAIEGGDWTVVVNSVTPGATDAILAANSFNDAPDAGTEYILVNYTATYTGDDAEGQMPAFVGVDYVTGAGVTVNTLDKLIVAPEAIDSVSTLYTGASATGNMAIQVPTPVDGVLAIRPGMIADTVFVAVQ